MVRGINKKGKEFYSIETGVPDDILNLRALAPDLWVASEYIMYHYNESTETEFFMSPGKYVSKYVFARVYLTFYQIVSIVFQYFQSYLRTILFLDAKIVILEY
jgi:hypothetical protein